MTFEHQFGFTSFAAVASLITIVCGVFAVRYRPTRHNQKQGLEKGRAGLPATQYTSDRFVLSAGAIAFSRSVGAPLRVCLVRQIKTDEWLFAKGRKDEGEDLGATAIREVFEETGYHCRLLPVTMPTRATAPSSSATHQPDVARIADNCVEPFSLTIRPGGTSVKLIYWYVGEILEECTSSGEVRGTHMEAESFGKSGLFTVEEALRMLTFESDRELLRTAVRLVESC